MILFLEAVDFERRFRIEEIIHEMLDNLSMEHVLDGLGVFEGELIPKLEILTKFSPAFCDSCWE